jgi:hypothetical protein
MERSQRLHDLECCSLRALRDHPIVVVEEDDDVEGDEKEEERRKKRMMNETMMRCLVRICAVRSEEIADRQKRRRRRRREEREEEGEGYFLGFTSLVDHLDDIPDALLADVNVLTSTLRSYISGCIRVSFEELREIILRYRCNSFELTDPESEIRLGEAVFVSVAAVLNHSCQPNAFVYLNRRDVAKEEEKEEEDDDDDDNDIELLVIAARDIDADEPVVICYNNPFLHDREKIRSFFEENYFFTCDCARCRPTNALKNASSSSSSSKQKDEKRRIPQLTREMSLAFSKNELDIVLTRAREIIRILDKTSVQINHSKGSTTKRRKIENQSDHNECSWHRLALVRAHSYLYQAKTILSRRFCVKNESDDDTNVREMTKAELLAELLAVGVPITSDWFLRIQSLS